MRDRTLYQNMNPNFELVAPLPPPHTHIEEDKLAHQS